MSSAGPSDIAKTIASNISLTNFVVLKGELNHQVWSDQLIMAFKATGLYDVALEGAAYPVGG